MAILDLEDDGDKSVKVAAPSNVKAAEPGWFEPGSRSEALVRGFSQGATLGLAPRISAMLSPGDTSSNLAAYLAANKAAEAAHPGYSMAGNVVGAAPSMIAAGTGTIIPQVAKGAGMSALDTLGSSEKTGMDLAKDVALGGAIGGVTTGALPVAGKVIKGASNLVRGVPDEGKIAEAAIKFKNMPYPNTKGTPAQTGAANKAFSELNTYITSSDDLAKMAPTRRAEVMAKEKAALEQLMREHPTEMMSPETMQTVINASNASNKGAALKEIVPEAMKQSAYGAGLGYVTSGGDINAAMAGGLTGLGTGAVTGGHRAMTGDSAKLRMPEAPREPSQYDYIGDAVEAGVKPLVTMGTQGLAKDIKEMGGVSTSPFGQLTDYFKQASGASNPDVQAAAQQAQAQVDPNDPDSKRKAAMQLQATPEGRAVGNSSSNIRDLD